MTDRASRKPDIAKLGALMERLRAPHGCPWDRAQTFESLVPFIIEEAYEVISAIDSGEPGEMMDELGDLLFQIVFVSEIAREKGVFTLADVIDASHEKMISRHPHVFGAARADTPEEVLAQWAEIKKKEKKGKAGQGCLAGIPETLPALMKAHKVSQKAAKTGFDWVDIDGVLQKLDEEVGEFKGAVAKKNAGEMEEELGDLLFTLVNVGRFLKVNPEDALRKTIAKFITRFHYIERALIERGEDLSSTHADDLERIWQEAKRKEKGG